MSHLNKNGADNSKTMPSGSGRFFKLKFFPVGQFLDRLNTLLGIVSGACLFSAMILISISVISRYVFNKPLMITEDLSCWLMMASVFLGAGYVIIIKGFPTVDILYNRLSLSMRSFLDMLGYILGLIFLGVILWKSTESTIAAIKLKSLTTGAVMWPQYPIYLVATIGIFLFFAQIMRNLISLIDYSLRRK